MFNDPVGSLEVRIPSIGKCPVEKSVVLRAKIKILLYLIISRRNVSRKIKLTNL